MGEDDGGGRWGEDDGGREQGGEDNTRSVKETQVRARHVLLTNFFFGLRLEFRKQQ